MSEQLDPKKVQFFVDPSGKTVTVNNDQAAEAEAAGYTPANDQQIQAFQQQVKYGSGVLNPIKAGAAAAGRTATFGLTDQALTKTGLVAPETLEGLKEANPDADTVGTAVGVVAPALVGDEAGLASALNPVKAVSRLGKAGEAAAAKLLPAAGESLASRVVASAVPKVVGSAIEGAAYGAGDVVSEQALGDPHLTAQSALAHIGLAGVLGGGLGAAFGTGEVLVPEAITKAKETIANAFKKGSDSALEMAKSFDKTTAPQVADLLIEHQQTIRSLEEAIPGAQEQIAKSTPEMAQFMVDNAQGLEAMHAEFPEQTKAMLGTSPETAQFLLDNYKQIWTDPAARTKAAQTLTDNMTEVMGAADRVMKQINGSLAPAEVEKLLEHADPRPAIEAYNKVSDQLFSTIDKMKSEPELFDRSYTRHLEQLQEGLVRDADQSLNPATAFKRFQTLRQSLDEAIPYGRTEMGLSERNAVEQVRDMRKLVKGLLTDEEVFGEAAARREALDSAQAQWLQLTGKNGPFRKKFMEKVGNRFELKATKVNTALNQANDQRGIEAWEAWGKTIETAKSLVDEAEKSFRAAPASEFDRRGYDSLMQKTRGSSDDVLLQAKATHVANQLDPKMQWGSNPVITKSPGVVEKAAHMVPGVSTVTGVLKGVATLKNTATSVPKTVAVLSALERAGQSVAAKIDSGVRLIMSGSDRAFRVGRGEVAAGLARDFGRDDDDSLKTFNARAKKISEAVSSPEAMHATLNRAAQGLHEHAPDTAGALQTSLLNGLQFLDTKLPKPRAGQGLRPFKATPSKADIARFNRSYHAVNKPLSILKAAATGTLTRDQVEAVATVHPALYGKMCQTVVNHLAEHPNKVISYAQRQQLGLLLGVPMDSSTSPQSLAANQATFAAAPQQGGGGAAQPTQAGLGKLDVAGRSRTAFQDSSQRA